MRTEVIFPEEQWAAFERALVPSVAAFGEILRQTRDDVEARAFPAAGAGASQAGVPYKPYSVYRLYISTSATPKPKKQPTRGGAGRTVRYEEGWGAGPDSYRGDVGLSIGAEKNLRLTGETARALRAQAITQVDGVIDFAPDRRVRGEQLNDEYDFMGLTPDEMNEIVARVELAVAAGIQGL